MPAQSVQVTFPENFNVKSLIFDPIQKRKIPSDNPDEKESASNTYHQISIRMRYPDGSEGPVILQLPRCPTFGINLGMNGETAVNKLSLSILLGERDNYSDEHKNAVRVLNEIVLACKNQLMTETVRDALGLEEVLEMRDLTGAKKEISPIRPAKDKDTKKPLPMDVRPPTLYARMMVRNDKDTNSKMIASKFYEENKFDAQGRPVEVDPRDYISKMGFCTALVKFESIYLGGKMKIQVKVFECDIKGQDNSFKSLIRRSAAPVNESAPAIFDDVSYDNEEDEDGSEDAPAASVAFTPAPQIMDEEMQDNDDEDDGEPEAKRPPTPPPVVAAPAPASKTPVRRGQAKK